MTIAIATLLCLGAGLLQLGAAPALFAPHAAPVLPLAVAAGWGASRRVSEAALGLLAAAMVLGIASEARAGTYLLAMLPALPFLAALEALPPSRRLLGAPLVGGLGAASYTGLLLLTAGSLAAFGSQQSALGEAVLWTAACAGLVAALMWPLRVRAAPVRSYP